MHYMNTADLTALLDRLHAEPRESKWLELKPDRYEPQAIFEYPFLITTRSHMKSKERQ